MANIRDIGHKNADKNINSAALKNLVAYKWYSTQNADYAQAYCVHDQITDEEIFSQKNITQLDAIVLESGQILYPPSVITYPQYSYIEENLRRSSKNMPVYITDVALEKVSNDTVGRAATSIKKIGIGATILNSIYSILGNVKMKNNDGYMKPLVKPMGRRMFAGIAFSSLGLVGLGYSPDFVAYLLTRSDEQTGDLLPKIIELRYNIEHTSLVTFRDAVTAKKTEEYIAPKLCSELGKKPKIALVYGLAHAGIETCLKNREYREGILEEFKRKECKLVLPSQLDFIVEMNYDTEWEFEFHESGLFPGKGY